MDCSTSLAPCCPIWISWDSETNASSLLPVTGLRAQPIGPAARPTPSPAISREERVSEGTRMDPETERAMGVPLFSVIADMAVADGLTGRQTPNGKAVSPILAVIRVA